MGTIEIGSIDWRNPNIELPPIGVPLLVVVSYDETVWPAHCQDPILPIDALGVRVAVMESRLTTYAPTKPHELHMTKWSSGRFLNSKIDPFAIRLWAHLPDVQNSLSFKSTDAQCAFYRTCEASAPATDAAEREECAKVCAALEHGTLAAQEGAANDLENVMLRQVASLGHAQCAAAIRARGEAV